MQKKSSNWYIVYYHMHLYCVFLDQKVKKVISNRCFQNMAAVNQHATVVKKAGECMFSHFLFPLFIIWLEFKAYGDYPHVL